MEPEEKQDEKTIIDLSKVKKKVIPSMYILFYRADEKAKWRLFPHSLPSEDSIRLKFKLFLSAKFTYVTAVHPE